jgi:hypothetical protein
VFSTKADSAGRFTGGLYCVTFRVRNREAVSMSIVDRAKNILLTPKTEWQVIAAEPATPASLYTGYAAILALLPLIGGVLAGLISGTGSYVIGYAVVFYAVQLALLYVIGLLAGVIAPSFDGRNDLTQGLKLVIYSCTPSWVLGLVTPFLPVGLTMILGLAALAYAIYILYLGVTPVMGVPATKSAGYTAVVAVIWFVAYFITGLIVGAIAAAIFGAALMGAAYG